MRTPVSMSAYQVGLSRGSSTLWTRYIMVSYTNRKEEGSMFVLQERHQVLVRRGQLRARLPTVSG